VDIILVNLVVRTIAIQILVAVNAAVALILFQMLATVI
jgi:hypothetical protein